MRIGTSHALRGKAVLALLHHSITEHFTSQEKHYGEYIVDDAPLDADPSTPALDLIPLNYVNPRQVLIDPEGDLVVVCAGDGWTGTDGAVVVPIEYVDADSPQLMGRGGVTFMKWNAAGYFTMLPVRIGVNR